MTDVFWLNNPTILFNNQKALEIWPKPDMSSPQKLNALTRLIIYLSILGYFITKNPSIFMTSFVTLAVICILHYISQNRSEKKEKKEGFTNPEIYKQLKNTFTNPTPQNPLMNVSLPEINENPNRPPAAPAYNREVEKEINASTETFIDKNFENSPEIKNKLFADLGDRFEFENGAMHNYYATANTQIPNDQKGFADFCYGSMISAKDGNDFALARNNPRIGSVVN